MVHIISNLLQETLDDITEAGLDTNKIVFIGSSNYEYECTWEEFKELANIKYDSGHGAQKVATDLIIVFDDGSYMDRKEYDGAEWWEVHKPVEIPDTRPKKKIERLVASPDHGHGWKSVYGLNAPDTGENYGK